MDRRGRNWKAKSGPPAGPANAVRLALRRPTRGAPDARALHYMPESAAASEHGAIEGGTRKLSVDAPPRLHSVRYMYLEVRYWGT